MKKINGEKLELLLSQYVDGKLSETEIKEIESLIASDISIKEKVDELNNLKKLLSAKQRLTPDIGFWTRLSVSLEEQKKEENNLFPFPRKYVPVVSVIMTLFVAIVGIIAVQNRTQIMAFFNEKSQAVKEVYEKNLLQSSLMPLFSKVDKDKALQFSLFGTLTLDDKSETSLRVDEKSDKGYRIEVGKDSKKKVKAVTFEKFVAEVKPTDEQKKIIDSLLELTGKRIESSVLIGENNTMAIAPDLPPLNKLMVTNIASCLEPHQRIRFEKLLEANDAPYSIASRIESKNKQKRALQSISKMPHDNNFVIITPDTIMYSRVRVNFDSLHKKMAEDMMAMELRREALLRRMLTREFPRPRRSIEMAKPVSPYGGEGFIRVEINTPNLELDDQPMQVIIQPRIRKQIILQETENRGTQIQLWKDTSVNPISP